MDLSQDIYLCIFRDKWAHILIYIIYSLSVYLFFCCFLLNYTFKSLNDHGRILGHSYNLLILSHELKFHSVFSCYIFCNITYANIKGKNKGYPFRELCFKMISLFAWCICFMEVSVRSVRILNKVKSWIHASLRWATLDCIHRSLLKGW